MVVFFGIQKKVPFFEPFSGRDKGKLFFFYTLKNYQISLLLNFLTKKKTFLSLNYQIIKEYIFIIFPKLNRITNWVAAETALSRIEESQGTGKVYIFSRTHKPFWVSADTNPQEFYFFVETVLLLSLSSLHCL